MPSDAGETTTLRELTDVLGTAVVELVDAPDGDAVLLGSMALVDSSDLSIATGSSSPALCLHVGVTNAEAVRWFDDVAALAPADRPRAVMSKGATGAVRAAARRAGVALVAVQARARWDHVLPLVQRMLDRRPGTVDPDLLSTETDLFDLARIVAQNAGGLVSIEDPHSRVLAYSASNEAADELRTLSILGREGPPDYLRALREQGVFARIRGTDDVIDVPAHRKLGTKRRLVVGVRQPPEGAATVPAVLGSIWLQEGGSPFSADAEAVLRGASAIAARIISRGLNAPSTEGLLIQRLFGARGGGVDVPSLAAALSLPVTGPAAVVGFAPTPSDGRLAGMGSLLRLHASSFRRDSVATIVDDRAYVLLPGLTSASTVATWTRGLVEEFEAKRSLVLRAAIAVPVPDLGQVGAARAEVDRVLDGTAATFPVGRVTTLAESRTAVLLGEILGLVGERPALHDPRLGALVDYDEAHGSNLRESAEVYLALHGDVRDAAAALRVHPNTLRYRVRRVEEIAGIDLGDPSDRLLFELQLALHRRRAS